MLIVKIIIIIKQDLVKQSADQTPYKNLSEAVKDRDVLSVFLMQMF